MLALGFAAIGLGAVLGIAGVTGSSLHSVVQGKPDRTKNTGLGASGSSTEPTASVGSSGNPNAVRKQIVQFFMGKGLTKAQAAGIAGNAEQESGLNPNASGGGLFQDIGGRSASGTGSLNAQLEAAWKELLGPESGALASLRRTSTPQQAAAVFSEQFERPGEPNLSNREQYAAEAFAE